MKPALLGFLALAGLAANLAGMATEPRDVAQPIIEAGTSVVAQNPAILNMPEGSPFGGKGTKFYISGNAKLLCNGGASDMGQMGVQVVVTEQDCSTSAKIASPVTIDDDTEITLVSEAARAGQSTLDLGYSGRNLGVATVPTFASGSIIGDAANWITRALAFDYYLFREFPWEIVKLTLYGFYVANIGVWLVPITIQIGSVIISGITGALRRIF